MMGFLFFREILTAEIFVAEMNGNGDKGIKAFKAASINYLMEIIWLYLLQAKF